MIGRVVSVNVPRRELRIAPETSHPERFHELQNLCIRTRQGQIVCTVIKNVRVTRSAVIARIDADDDSMVASTRGGVVVVSRTDRFRLPENEYYVDDLIGLIIKDKEGKIIGRLAAIWETPANDIYQVLDEDGHEILLPAIEDVVLRVDIEGGEMIADISSLA